MNFEVIHVSAVGVDLGADRVSSSMDEVLLEARVPDVVPHGVINFPSGKSLPLAHAFDHRLYPHITRLANDAEYFPHAIRRRLAHKAGPGNVIVYGPGRVLFCPDVEQDKITFTNGF